MTDQTSPSAAHHDIIRASALTEKEIVLLKAIDYGMDEPGVGWLHEITPFENDHIAAGVLGSLINKGLATSDEDREGPVPCYWVQITDSGREALA